MCVCVCVVCVGGGGGGEKDMHSDEMLLMLVVCRGRLGHVTAMNRF